jgi:hypothetical protein
MTRAQSERQLILLSAGVSARRHSLRRQAERLLAELDWTRLEQTLRMRRLLTGLGPRIVAISDGSASDEFVSAVDRSIEAARRQSTFLQFVCQQMMADLAKAGIRSAPLKGPMLSEAIYGDPGRRISRDIDLLVEPSQLRAATAVVRKLGYEAPTDYVDRSGMPRIHFALIHGEAKLPPVELHWRIHWYEREFARDRLLPSAVNAVANWRPALADELAALLLFYARDGFVDLRLATDLSAWWDSLGTELPPGAFSELLDTYPALVRVISAAANVADKTLGIPAAHIIGRTPKLDTRSRIAARLVDPNPYTSEPQLHADMGLIDGLLTPRGGFRAFVRRQIFLPAAALREYARREPSAPEKSSFGHSWRVLVRYGLAMIRIIRGPEELNIS